MHEFDAAVGRRREMGERRVPRDARSVRPRHRIEIVFQEQFAHPLILIGRDHDALAHHRRAADRLNCLIEPTTEHRRGIEPEAAERLFGIMPALDGSLLEQLRDLRVQTLLIHGSADAFASTVEMEYLSSLIAGSKLVVMQGSGHLPLMIRPHDTATAINDFFAR